MYRSSLFLTAALVGTTVTLVQPAAVAKSASEIKAIARAVTVEIKLQRHGSVGSGVIIDKKGDFYTLVTNGHVVCGENTKERKLCEGIPTSETYSLNLADGKQYVVKASSVKLLGNDLDLAIIQFRSSRNYAVAKVAPPGSLKVENAVYTAGFPDDQLGFSFDEGSAIAVVNKRLTGDNGGYTIAYDASTLPGMSGGGVFNGNSQLVAIHGVGERYRKNSETDDKSRVGSKIGLNRGISVRWLVQKLAEVGINLGIDRSISGVRNALAQLPTAADEYFIAGFNKVVEPGDNVAAGKQQAIQKFSRAIRLNSKYRYAYFMRAVAYSQVQEFQKSLADYNKAISIDPTFYAAYDNRASLKDEKLNDVQGALADYNKAISIDPTFYAAYNNRAVLKYERLNDVQGALADFNKAISLNPKYSTGYDNRANLKYERLNDIQGALADFNKAISLNPKYSNFYYSRARLKYTKLNDIPGALADCNKAISLNPKYSNVYYNRAVLKYEKLNDRAGAIQDLRQAAKLFREQGNTQGLQKTIKYLRQLGATK
jgi:tetratricopeptide (TPR) repeat protein/V8-like Glu-specific endopeptidase